jgi:hypothetical protein
MASMVENDGPTVLLDGFDSDDEKLDISLARWPVGVTYVLFLWNSITIS